MKKIGVILLLIPIFFFGIITYASAQMQLVPAHTNIKNPKSFTSLILEGKPGEEKQAEFAAVNLSNQKADLKFDSSDAVVNEKGEIVGSEDVKKDDIGGWIKLPDKDTSVLPKSRRNFQAVIKIPTDAKPGDHIGTIVVGNAYLPVWVNVVGEVKIDYLVNQFSQDTKDGVLQFKAKVKNTGSSVVKSLGFKIILTNFFGFGSSRTLESFWGEEINILPGGEKEFDFTWENVLPAIGKYQADLEVSVGENKKQDKLSFTFINWSSMAGFLLKVVAFLLILAGIIFGILKLRKKFIERLFEHKINTKISIQKPAVNTDIMANVTGSSVSGEVRKIALEEGQMAIMKEEDYDRLWFKVRKIVREEIELWKEMEKYRKEIKKELKKELLKEKK